MVIIGYCLKINNGIYLTRRRFIRLHSARALFNIIVSHRRRRRRHTASLIFNQDALRTYSTVNKISNKMRLSLISCLAACALVADVASTFNNDLVGRFLPRSSFLVRCLMQLRQPSRKHRHLWWLRGEPGVRQGGFYRAVTNASTMYDPATDSAWPTSRTCPATGTVTPLLQSAAKSTFSAVATLTTPSSRKSTFTTQTLTHGRRYPATLSKLLPMLQL